MFSNYQQLPVAIATLTAGTETAYQTASPAAVPPAPQGVVIRGYVNVTGGATGGGWTIRCRRGVGVAGAQVGLTQTYTMPASTTVSIPYSFVDTAPPAGQNSVYTVTVTAAGSNGVGNDGALEVVVPEPAGSDV